MNKPEPDKEFLELEKSMIGERLWREPYHLTKTRTTFINFSYLSYWDAAKLQFYDGNIPYKCVQMYSFTIEDLKHLKKMCDSMIQVMERTKLNE